MSRLEGFALMISRTIQHLTSNVHSQGPNPLAPVNLGDPFLMDQVVDLCHGTLQASEAHPGESQRCIPSRKSPILIRQATHLIRICYQKLWIMTEISTQSNTLGQSFSPLIRHKNSQNNRTPTLCNLWGSSHSLSYSLSFRVSQRICIKGAKWYRIQHGIKTPHTLNRKIKLITF